MDQYYPSEEEMIVSELSRLIISIIDLNSKEKIDDIKKSEGINYQTTVFNEIIFRHVEVMDSRRFSYAEK